VPFDPQPLSARRIRRHFHEIVPCGVGTSTVAP
jgi:hypothetical protein